MKTNLFFICIVIVLFLSCHNEAYSKIPPTLDAPASPAIYTFTISAYDIHIKNEKGYEFDFKIALSGLPRHWREENFSFKLYLKYSTLGDIWWGPFIYDDASILGGDAHVNDVVSAYVVVDDGEGNTYTTNTINITYEY